MSRTRTTTTRETQTITLVAENNNYEGYVVTTYDVKRQQPHHIKIKTSRDNQPSIWHLAALGGATVPS